jgi:hypothetical protein
LLQRARDKLAEAAPSELASTGVVYGVPDPDVTVLS